MFKVGDKVVFMNAEKHESLCGFYPEVGTVGTVVQVEENATDEYSLLVDWGDAKGINVWRVNNTKSWWCNKADVKLYICDGSDCADEEVWKMLKPKMERIVTLLADVDNFHDEVKKMVVDAYRSGYGRAMKGRPFRIKPKNIVKN